MKIRNEYDSREAILPQRDQGKTPVMEAIGLGIGFGGLTEDEIRDGLERLAAAWLIEKRL